MTAWIKTAWKAVAGFASGASWTWALWVALGAAVVGGVTHWHLSGIKQARADGMAFVKAEWQASINTALIERNREISRLITVNQGIQDELNAVEVAASDLARDRARALSLRDKAARNAAIANAATGALREHAARAEDDLERSQEEVERFGLEAVRASAAAHALAATLRARRPLTTPSMPESPFTPKE